MTDYPTSMEELRPLHDMITSDHLGDYLELERRLSHTVFLLHHIPWDTFDMPRTRDTVFLIEKLRECFQKARDIQQRE